MDFKETGGMRSRAADGARTGTRTSRIRSDLILEIKTHDSCHKSAGLSISLDLFGTNLAVDLPVHTNLNWMRIGNGGGRELKGMMYVQ